MGFGTRLNGCKFRRSLRVVGESDMDHINAEGGEMVVVDSQCTTQEQSNVNKYRNVLGHCHEDN